MLEYEILQPLETRQRAHLLYSVPRDDVEVSTLSATPIARQLAVLDVGCGTGSFLGRLADGGHFGPLVGLDSSFAAARCVRSLEGAGAIRGDACRLPFGASTFDVVFARHMLYHVSDVRKALGECRRVLVSGGRFVAVVNHPEQAPQISALLTRIAVAHGISVPKPTEVDSEYLPKEIYKHFGNVWTRHVNGALIFPEPAPLIEYAISLFSFYGIPPTFSVRGSISRQVADEITRYFEQSGAVWRDVKGYAICVGLKKPDIAEA